MLSKKLRYRRAITKVYVWSIPVVTLDTVSKKRLYLRNAWIACVKVKGVVPRKFQKATSNFILIV